MMSQRVAISGSNGFIGSAVAAQLVAAGHVVIPIRRDVAPGSQHIAWDGGRVIDADVMRSCDAIIHLAGAGIADQRWSDARMRDIRDSRVVGTTAIASLLACDPGRVRTLLCSSGCGFYGDRGDDALDEDSAGGSGFLADVCRDWEAACDPARNAVRVANLRFGIVLGHGGGPLAKMIPPARWGLSGALGSGRQWWPWIATADAVAAISYILQIPALAGPINVVAPQAIRQRDLARAIAAACHRPAWGPPAPAWILRLMLGRMVDHALLASAQVEPKRLRDAGFSWQLPAVQMALAKAVSQPA